MTATLEESIRRYASKLFASADDLEQKYYDLLAFLDKKCPSRLWEELRKVQPAEDIRGLANWAKSIEPTTLKDAKRIAFGLGIPDVNVYCMDCCYYTIESFDAPKLLSKGKGLAITGLSGLVEIGNIIGISNDDAPSSDVVLADRYVPLVYAALVLADWLAADTAWFGGEKCNVYLMNFGVEAIPLGTLRDGAFVRVRKFL